VSNDLHSLLPPNAPAPERAIESTMASATDLPVPVPTVWDPARCPGPLLPWLAWAMSVDDWDSEWPDSVKRSLIAESLRIHRIKGTVAAIRRVLRVLGVEAELAEWFQIGDPPHTFRLTAWANANLHASSEAILSPALYTALKRSVDAVKPVRSHYAFRVGARFDDSLGMAGTFLGNQALRRGSELIQEPLNSQAGFATTFLVQTSTVTRLLTRPEAQGELDSFDLKTAASIGATVVVRTRMETSV